MAVGMWLTLISRLLVGGLPFLALGFTVGYLASPNAAAPLLQIVFLPLSFASGRFLPTSMLPPFVQNLAPYLPTNRFGQVFFFQAEDGIRDLYVTGVQTCALPI